MATSGKYQYLVPSDQRESLLFDFERVIRQNNWRKCLLDSIQQRYRYKSETKYRNIITKTSIMLSLQENFGMAHPSVQKNLQGLLEILKKIVPDFDLDPSYLQAIWSGTLIRPNNWLIKVDFVNSETLSFTFAVKEKPEHADQSLLDLGKIAKSSIQDSIDQGLMVEINRGKLVQLYQLAKSFQSSVNPLLMILRVVLRYHYLFVDTGLFLSLIPEFWPFYQKYIIEKFPQALLIEGFAYPLNNNFQHFFSLYPEVDAPFGSIGNFFKTNLLEQPYLDREIFMAINPPYIEDILLEAGRLILIYLERKPKFTAVITWPYWLKEAGIDYFDEPILREMINLPSSLLRWMKVLEKDKHTIFNLSTNTRLTASFSEVVLMVSNNPNVRLTLSEVQPYFS